MAMPPSSLLPRTKALPLRVALADDSLLIREGLARLLEPASAVRLVSEHGDPDSLLAAVDADPPDVVIVDVRMPPTFTDEGLRVAERLRRTHPGIGVLVLSQQRSADAAARLLAGGAGGRGYLFKDHVHDVPYLLSAIEAVAAGECRIDPELVDGLLAARRQQRRGSLDTLTPRQRQILAAISVGKSNLAIANEFEITQGAVEKHVNDIFARLGIANDESVSRRVRATLMYLAQENR
jgi:DNA-binding NarL/FixJ family response regulator